MQKLSLVLALSLSLLACGKQESAPNPFGKTGSESKEEKEMTEFEFKKDCARKNGDLRSQDTLCFHVPYKFTFTPEIKEELEKKGIINVAIGNVVAGNILWGEAKGGQPIGFLINNQPYEGMHNGRVGKIPLSPGKLSIRIEAGQYEYINAYVAQCFTRAGNAACPMN